MVSAIRIALRQFRQHPTFALVTVLVLGLGTGAATTVFTIVDAVVLRPLPYAAPDRLVTFWDTNTEQGLAHDPISPVNFMDYRALPVFKDAAAWWRPGVNLFDPGLDPVRVNTIEVERQPVRRARRAAADRRRIPRERPVLPSKRARRRDQRSALAHALQRRSLHRRPAARPQRHAVHGRRRDAGEVSLSRTTSTCGSGCGGICTSTAARRISWRRSAASPTGRRSTKRRARPRRSRCGCKSNFPTPTKDGAHASSRCSTSSSATTGRR